MSGGANKGSYEAGVIQGLAHSLPQGELAWDVVTGVSAGALNAAGISLWPIGQEADMSDWLVNTWLNLTDSSVYKDWPLGIVNGVMFQSGIYNNSPLL